MPKILIIHGAGMNMRGKVQLEIFGPMTLPEYDERIRGYAAELGLDIEIFHSNIEGEIVNKIYAANDQGVEAAIFNPAAFGTGYPALVAALSQVKFPTIEVHISNIHRREPFRHHSYVSAVANGVARRLLRGWVAIQLTRAWQILPSRLPARVSCWSTTRLPTHRVAG